MANTEYEQDCSDVQDSDVAGTNGYLASSSGTSDDDDDYSVSSSVPPDVPTVRRPCAADVRGLHGVLRDVANGGPLRRGEREHIACNSGGI